MILSSNQELRLHVPSNAIDDIATIQGILDNSEKDVLKDKLGASLYNRLCEEYQQMDPLVFYDHVQDGTYIQNPWEELLLNAQRVVANEAMARFAYQQIISINGAGVNIASSNDYDAASEKLLDKGVAGYKKEAMVSLNNLLLMLENMAKAVASEKEEEQAKVNAEKSNDIAQNANDIAQNANNIAENAKINAQTGAKEAMAADGTNVREYESINVPEHKSTNVPEYESTDESSIPTKEQIYQALETITSLWQQSKYYYLHHDLLIPTCEVLQQYLDIYENRDKFIRLIPDLRFIQEEYITDAFGEDFVNTILKAKDRDRMLKKVRRLIVAHLEQRTTVLNIDKARKVQAHDEAVSLKESILRMIKEKEQAEQEQTPAQPGANDESGTDSTQQEQPPFPANPSPVSPPSQGYKNNQPGGKIFVSPLLF